MNINELKQKNLPETPGVYFFLGLKKEILYVGKATSLKDRVKSYFDKNIIRTRGPLIEKMVFESTDIEYTETQSVLEALILEASQIKKHQPNYNIKEKDNKSFNYVVITDEDFPRVLIERGRDLSERKDKGYKIKSTFGPFPHGSELREAMKIIRRLFPFRDKCIPKNDLKNPDKARLCFNAQIGLCPGVCNDGITKREYRKRIKHLELFFEGKKDTLIKELEKEMKESAKNENFEEASRFKRTLYSLEHIQDVALIKNDTQRILGENVYRIEAFDIAHMSGKETVGVMVVIEDDELAKSQYRKFKIRGRGDKVRIDDTNNLKEVLSRRFTHLEWPFPNLIVIDGGVGQINAAKKTLEDMALLTQNALNIEVVSVVKDIRHKAKDILGITPYLEEHKKSILLANSEAHRFAITYHRKLRTKGFRI
jgi:excinuclease ABC subunit C